MMKKYICVFLLSSIVMACKQDLDKVNPNVITQESFWKTEDDVLSGLAATYKYFKHRELGYWGYKQLQLINGRGDDFFIRNDVNDMYQLSTFTNNPTTSIPSDLFRGAFTAIFRANQVIMNTPNAEISEELKLQYMAEARFLRALNYFHLAINFGAVPIITTVPETRDEYFVKQSPETMVWDQVIEDLQNAKTHLPVEYSSNWKGRATRGAAIGYLGKAYLYQEKWLEAENEFKLLAQSNGSSQAPFKYDLLANYEHNFMKEYDNNIESLFEIQIQNSGGSNSGSSENADESQGTVTAFGFAPTEVGGWFQIYPTNKMFDEFQKEKTVDGDFDPRMYASVVWRYPGAMYYNKPFTEFSVVFKEKSRIRKYQNWRENDEGIQISEINEKALRYADILLMYAESLTMQGKVMEAYPLVDRIRTRANLATLSPINSKEDMLLEIQHQRMVEFYREGHRFYDLKRWGLLEKELSNSDKEGREFFNRSKHAYFPIPQNELNTNPSIEQNPNW